MARVNREEDILLAAIKVFSEKGYSAATTSEIAKEAQVAEGTIFRYYKTKKDILLKVAGRVVDNFANDQVAKRAERILMEGMELEPKRILMDLSEDRISLFVENIELLKTVLVEALYNDELRGIIMNTMENRMLPIMGMLFKNWEKRGYIRRLEPHEVLAAMRSFFAMIIAHTIQMLFLNSLGGFDAKKDLETVVDMFLRGLGKEQSE